jgi:exopolysaccharide biosynthesis polyprenyl glycosylphosphotransferase
MTALLPIRGTGTSTAEDARWIDRATGRSHAPAHRVRAPRRQRLVAIGDLASAIAVLGLLSPFTTVHPLRDGLLVAAWLIALAAARGYDAVLVPFWPDEVRRVWTAAIALAALLPLVAGQLGGPINRVAGATITAALFGVAATSMRWILRAGVALRFGGRVGALRVVVAGHRRDVDRLVAELGAVRFRGYDVVDVCDVPPGSPDALARMAEVVRSASADALLVAPCRHLEAKELRRLTWQLERSGARLLVSTSLLDVSPGRTHLAHAGGLPLVSVRHARTQGGSRMVKAVTERALAAAALIVLSPLLLAIAILIRIDSPGPALFRQRRVGKDGVGFSMLKYRTMHQGAEELRPTLDSLVSPTHVLFKLRDDPRVTRVGGFLRRYSLDELPQLINVVRGDMALVGPRPPLPDEVARYETDVLRRLAVKPGITGLWQVSGRSDLSWDDSVRLDLRYVDNWSLGHDWLIIARTFSAVLAHRGAY